MKRRRPPIDLNNLTFVPANKVPERVFQTQWEELFKRVPPGQALTLDENQANPDSVRGALKRCHARKEFANLDVRVRGPRGKRVTYIVNSGAK